MLRALFEKTGNAIYISHLDLMRLFQRAFKRAELPLTHTRGFNPRPSVSIALPLSLGAESHCELLDFELEGENPPALEEIRRRLNDALIRGVQVIRVYENGDKLKNLSLLESVLTLEYDAGVPEGAEAQISALFAREEVVVEKKGKKGSVEQNLIPMLRRFAVEQAGQGELALHVLASCRNPTLNPMQLSAAISKYLPELAPDFVRCCRVEIYDANETVFR